MDLHGISIRDFDELFSFSQKLTQPPLTVTYLLAVLVRNNRSTRRTRVRSETDPFLLARIASAKLEADDGRTGGRGCGRELGRRARGTSGQ